jgi:hypothetical protein
MVEGCSVKERISAPKLNVCLGLTNLRKFNLYAEHSTKREIVAKIQDTRVAKLWELLVPYKFGQM